MNRVLIYRLGSLGDTLVALPVFHLVRDTFPSAHIDVLTNEPVQDSAPPLASVLEHSGLVDGTLGYPIGLRNWDKVRRLRREIAAKKYDLAINLASVRPSKKLATSVRDHLFLRWCGAKRVIGTPYRKRDLNCALDERTGLFESEAKRLARRLKPLGEIDLDSPNSWDLRLTTDERSKADSLMLEHGISGKVLAFSLGTKADTKDWTQPNWLRLLDHLGRTRRDVALVGIGSPGDWQRTQECMAVWTGRAANLCGVASVRVMAAVLQRALVFVGHDSGPGHLAATVGTPCVGIHSATNLAGQWFPRGNHNKILLTQPACRGCGLLTCEQYDKKCIRDVSWVDVAAAVSAYL